MNSQKSSDKKQQKVSFTRLYDKLFDLILLFAVCFYAFAGIVITGLSLYNYLIFGEYIEIQNIWATLAYVSISFASAVMFVFINSLDANQNSRA